MDSSTKMADSAFDDSLNALRDRISEGIARVERFLSGFHSSVELRYHHPEDGDQTRTVSALLRIVDGYPSKLEAAAAEALGDEGDESEASITNLQNEASALLLELEAIMKAVECSAEEA